MQFDVNRVFDVRIFSAGRKACQVRWPEDALWRDFFRAQSVVRTVTDGGLLEASSRGAEEAASAIFSAIRVDTTGPAFDEYDAAAVLRKLEFVELEAPARIGNDRFNCVMAAVLAGNRAVFTTLQHELRLPTQRQITIYRRRALRVLEGRQKTEVRNPIEPGEELYDQLVVGTVGYVAGRVPVTHKAFVADALMVAVDRMLAEEEQEEAGEQPRPEA